MVHNSEIIEVESEDLRVRRTRLSIQEALLELTVEKGFAKVSVRDITERAMVNRSTFYRHYIDKYDLLDKYMQELAALVASTDGHMAVEEKAHPNERPLPEGLIKLLRHIRQFSDFYRVMLGANGDTRFIQWFRMMIENRFRYIIANNGVEIKPHEAPLDMRLSYISCGDIGVILWWLEQAPELTPEQTGQMIMTLTTASAGLIPRTAPQPV